MLIWGDTGFEGPRTAVVVEIWGTGAKVFLAIKAMRSLYRVRSATDEDLGVLAMSRSLFGEGGTPGERRLLAEAGYKIDWRGKPE